MELEPVTGVIMCVEPEVIDKYCIAHSGNFPLRRAFNHSDSINAQKIGTCLRDSDYAIVLQ